MIERIKQVMEYKQMSPTAFADKININRSSLTHIFSGRNQPSLDVAKKILSAFPEIRTEWLIMGVGAMLQEVKSESVVTAENTYSAPSVSTVDNMQQTDLFSAFDADFEEPTAPVVGLEAADTIQNHPKDDSFESVSEEMSSSNESISEQLSVQQRKVAIRSAEDVVAAVAKPSANTNAARSRTRSTESHYPSGYSKRERISNSQGDKRLAKIIFFYEDKSFDVYMPNI